MICWALGLLFTPYLLGLAVGGCESGGILWVGLPGIQGGDAGGTAIDVVPDKFIWALTWLHYLDYEPIHCTPSTFHLVRTRNVLGQTVSSLGWCKGIPRVVLLFVLFSEQFASDRLS